jgi:hypothetical protein
MNIKTFEYNSNEYNVLGLVHGDYFNLIDKTISYKEKTAKNRWVYNYSYTISILGQFPLIPNAGTNCRVIDQKNWENILKNSRHWHKKL